MIDRAHLLPSSLPELTLVKGPGGYGKTIATSQWARNLQADTRVVWVFGAVVSSEHFWQEHFEALSSRLEEDNALHPDALATFTRHQPGDTAEMKARRVAGAIESNFVLVIDNFEALTTPEIDLGLIEMVEQSPGLKLVVLGRRYTLLDGPLTKARLRTHVITAENLAFREQDVRELAQTCGELAQTCGELDDETNAMLIEATAGWPLAVQAVLSNGPHTESRDADPRISLAHLPARLSLVANDFLMLLGSAKQRRALLAVAYCPGLSARAFATAILTQSHEEHASETYKLALRIFSEVSDLGLIAHERPPQTDRYRCHPGLESEFSRLAEQEFSEHELKRLVREHAADLAIDDPFSAVVLYCEVDDFAAAERLMVSHHAEVTGIDRGLGRTMRGIPTEKLAGFPMLAAARLVIGIFDKLTSDEWVRTNLEALRGDVLRILAEGQAETETSAYWVLMFVERMLGNQELAMSLARELEQRLGERPQKPGLQMSGSTSFAYVQLGFTAILNGDFEFASRCYGRASRLSTESGALTEQIRALYGLALCAYANGRMQGAQEFVERAERLEREWSELGPQLVAFEIAPVRVILAASQGDEAEMKRLFDEMTPLCRRLETWPLILLAEAKMNCRSHGNYSALSVLCSRLAEGKRVVATTNYLKTGLTLSVIGMQMRLGNLASAEQQLQNLPDQTVEKSLATARIMLLRGAAEQANLILETELPGPLNRQQRCEYLLLSAVTSWRMGFREEALRDFIETMSTMEEHDGYQQLSTAPYETLLAQAQETERAGVEGILNMVTDLPENARCYQYELLGWECGRQTRRMTSCGY